MYMWFKFFKELFTQIFFTLYNKTIHQTQFKEDTSFWTDSPRFWKTYYTKRSSHKNKFNLGLLTASFSGQWARMKIELPKESWPNSLLTVIKKKGNFETVVFNANVNNQMLFPVDFVFPYSWQVGTVLCSWELDTFSLR